MEGFTMLAVVLLAATPILAIVAGAVGFAGNSRILNSVDYAKVADAPAMHAWAGRRLAILPVLSLGFGLLGLRVPMLALVLAGLFTLIALVLATWLMLAAERFQSMPLKPGRSTAQTTTHDED